MLLQALLYHFLSDVPQAVAIGSSLMVIAAVLLAALVARPDGDDRAWPRLLRADRLSQPAVGAAAPAAHRGLSAAERGDLVRYADEVAVAAERATTTARRHRNDWQAAQVEVETAWRAYQEAEVATERLAGAALFGVPGTPQTPGEYADRERYLHRAATAAYWRQELSLEQLTDVLAHRNGWDPRRHPVQQELVLARAIRDHLAARHRAASVRERETWRTAELAALAARSLRLEAFRAADQLRVVSAPRRVVASVRASRPLRAGLRAVQGSWQARTP